MRLHAVVDDVETARIAVEGGATVLQLRLKNVPTATRIEMGRLLLGLGVPVVVNDDIDAALGVGAAGVHLGQGDRGADRAIDAGLLVGISVSTGDEARLAEQRGATYVGAGPVWSTPSKADAGEPIGLDGLAAVCTATALPVIAIGGVHSGNAGACVRAGAHGVAVIRAARDAAAVRAAIEAVMGNPLTP